MDPNKLELAKFLSSVAESETNRGWTRFSTLLYVNTALLGMLAFALTVRASPASGLFALMGCVISVAWLRLVQASFFLDHRWLRDLEEIIQSDEFLKEWVRARSSSPRLKRVVSANANQKLLYTVPGAFLAFWVLVLLVIAASFFWEPAASFLYSLGRAAT